MFAYCMTVVLLALNRYLELSNPWLAKSLFDGRKCWLWLALPLLLGSWRILRREVS